MAISVGDKLPDAKFGILEDGSPGEVSARELLDGRKVVLFAVPGAFTPTCHRNHLPGFMEHEREIRSRGVDEVLLVAINDVWVLGAWSNQSGADGKIRFLSDASGDFTRALGMEIDLGAAGLGMRSKRYSMIVEDGVVKSLNVEDAPSQAVISGAAAILDQLPKGAS